MSKNTRTRILLTAVAALLLVTMAVGGTLAWLQDTTETVDNTFTPTTLNIELDEDGADANGNQQFEMVPGKEITKRPYITVDADSEKLWLFVEITESANFDAFMSYSVDTAQGWQQLKNGETVIENVYYQIVETPATDKVIDILANDQVVVHETVKNTDMAGITNNPTLSFQAYAVQYEYLTYNGADVGENAYNAWQVAQNATVYTPAN